MGNGQPPGRQLRARNRRVRGAAPATEKAAVTGDPGSCGACADAGESLAAGTQSIERCIASGKEHGDSRAPDGKRNRFAAECVEEPGSQAAKAALSSLSTGC